MVVLRIVHAVRDYDRWKQTFDSDPLDRRGSGVRRYRVSRAVDEPGLVHIDLEFDDVAAAERLRAGLAELWAGPARGLLDGPTARIVEVVEDVTIAR